MEGGYSHERRPKNENSQKSINKMKQYFANETLEIWNLFQFAAGQWQFENFAFHSPILIFIFAHSVLRLWGIPLDWSCFHVQPKTEKKLNFSREKSIRTIVGFKHSEVWFLIHFTDLCFFRKYFAYRLQNSTRCSHKVQQVQSIHS